MTQRYEFKPNKTPFVYYPLLIQAGVIAVILLCIYLASFVVSFPVFESMGIVLGLGLLSEAWSLFVQVRVYDKTAFIVLPDRIIAKGGGVIAEYEKELLIKNITHINLSLPFIEHKFFQTGTVNVQAAGGADVEVHFDSIDNPREMFELIEERMRDIADKAEWP